MSRPNITSNSTGSSRPTIFVSIPSYRDSECQHTIASLFKQASYPEAIHVGVCWQYDPAEDAHCFTQLADNPHAGQVRTIMMHYTQARGPCYARALAQGLYAGETYYLQVDSHMRFVRDWDVNIIQQLESVRDFSAARKPLLTTYPSGYTLPDQVPDDVRPNVLCAKEFSHKDGMLRITGKTLRTCPPVPLPCRFVAAGFLFCDGNVVEEVPYDPNLKGVFFGEEAVLAVRLWTHGYDFFTPKEAVVFHLWSRDHRPTFREIEQPEAEAAVGQKRVLALLNMAPFQPQEQGDGDDQSADSDPDCLAGSDESDGVGSDSSLDSVDDEDTAPSSPVERMRLRRARRARPRKKHRFGLGLVRTLADYEHFSGVHFAKRKIDKEALSGGVDPSKFVSAEPPPVLDILAKLGFQLPS